MESQQGVPVSLSASKGDEKVRRGPYEQMSIERLYASATIRSKILVISFTLLKYSKTFILLM